MSLALGACGLVKAGLAFTAAGNDFMTALKEGNYEAAYALCHPALQQEIGTVADLQNMIESNAAQPEDQSFSSVNTNTDADGFTKATMDGSVTYQDGKTGTISLELVQDGEDWLITSFNLYWQVRPGSPTMPIPTYSLNGREWKRK